MVRRSHGKFEMFSSSFLRRRRCWLVVEFKNTRKMIITKNYTEAKATSVALTRQRHCQRNGNYRLAAKSLHLFSFVLTFVLFCQDRKETKIKSPKDSELDCSGKAKVPCEKSTVKGHKLCAFPVTITEKVSLLVDSSQLVEDDFHSEKPAFPLIKIPFSIC